MTLEGFGRLRRMLQVLPLVAALLGAAGALADHTEFFYQLDSAGVVGNASNGAGCFEDFDAGFGGWSPAIGNPTVSGGFVVFENPGEHQDVLLPFYDLVVDREDIRAPSACQLTYGNGDATLTTEWVNHMPSLPGGFHGIMLFYPLGSSLVEGFNVSLSNADATVAAEFGIAPGLHLSQNRFLLDTSDPQAVVLADEIEIQTAALAEAALASAVGGRIFLRLSYDETAQTIVGSYSLDGEATYLSPFVPVTTAFSSAGPASFWVIGDPMTPLPKVPALHPFGVTLLVGLIVASGGRSLRSTRGARAESRGG